MEIPKIKLKQGFFDIDNNKNDVDLNIMLIDSQMPDIINGNLVLAAHNGNTQTSYFRNITKLRRGDKIYVYYNGYKYIYEVDNNYDVIKKGIINIVRNKDKNTLTLVTCKDNNEMQVVYISYLIDKVIY